jgi:hypothetical protein
MLQCGTGIRALAWRLSWLWHASLNEKARTARKSRGAGCVPSATLFSCATITSPQSLPLRDDPVATPIARLGA